MSNYFPDVGGVFASDVHRRTAGHLPIPGDDPISPASLLLRMDPDPFTPLGEPELVQVLEELVGSGLAEEGWRLAEAGLVALGGPIANEPPPLKGAALKAAKAADAELLAADQEMAAAGQATQIEELEAALEEAQKLASE